MIFFIEASSFLAIEAAVSSCYDTSGSKVQCTDPANNYCSVSIKLDNQYIRFAKCLIYPLFKKFCVLGGSCTKGCAQTCSESNALGSGYWCCQTDNCNFSANLSSNKIFLILSTILASILIIFR